MLLTKMKNLNEWEQVYEDPEWEATIVRNFNALKAILKETRSINMREENLRKR